MQVICINTCIKLVSFYMPCMFDGNLSRFSSWQYYTRTYKHVEVQYDISII